MNEGRFDGLAKGLATNQLSRGQVLKSFAAGVLLAGPLGALLNKSAWGQTTGCVEPSCVDSAKQAYARCTKRCKRLSGSKRKKCLKKCNNTYSTRLTTCGCVTLKVSTTGKTATPVPCQDLCTAKTLSDKASKDADHSALVNHLTSNGFSADGGLLAILFQEGSTQTPTLFTLYKSAASGQHAVLLYWEGQAAPLSAAYIYKDKKVHDVLLVDYEGNVFGSATAENAGVQNTTTQNTETMATAESSSTCSDQAAKDCVKDADFTLSNSLQNCGLWLPGCVLAVLSGLWAPIVCLASLLSFYGCTKLAHEAYVYERKKCVRDTGACSIDKECAGGECRDTCDTTSDCSGSGETCMEGICRVCPEGSFECDGGRCCPVTNGVCCGYNASGTWRGCCPDSHPCCICADGRMTGCRSPTNCELSCA